MSYCRFGVSGSDVYVIEADEGFVCYCERRFVCPTPEQMIYHLADHRRRGDFVPAYAVEGLWHDIPGASAPVDRGPGVAAAREALDNACNTFKEYVNELRKAYGICSECGRRKEVD